MRPHTGGRVLPVATAAGIGQENEVPDSAPLGPDPASKRSASKPADAWVLAVVAAGVVFPAPKDHPGDE